MARKIITLFPLFKDEQTQEVLNVIKQIFGSTPHNCEIIIVHNCKNPDCQVGIMYGVIGTEEDEIIAVNFAIDQIDREEQDLKSVMKNVINLPKDKLTEMAKSN